MFVDSHVNLHDRKFADDVDDVIARAHAADITTMLNICCNIKDIKAVLKVTDAHENMWASIGTHPHNTKDNPHITPETLMKFVNHPGIIGIGETGLDYHYGFSEPAVQRHNFMVHIEVARETGLPLIIHSRAADDEMGNILEDEMKKGEFPALLHCYTSGERLACRAAEMGVYFSMSGIITFRNAHDVRNIAAWLPGDKLMVETDCPYLAPVPHRGKRNEPAFVVEVVKKLAEIRDWTLTEAAGKTTGAFFDLFKKADISAI
ncbi:MAG: TatD family hydrolase [Hyphomonadaceae bacterium]|nr:TatD family hydrolase [Hyphomonadaceae bacterium]